MQQGNGDADTLFYLTDEQLKNVAHLQDKYFLLCKGFEGTSLL